MESTDQPDPILNSVEKVIALPQKIPIYFYAGHGNDLCSEDTKKPIVKKVPENCIYITITECGLPSILDVIDNPQEKAFRSKNPFHKKLIQYPYLRDNKKKLAELLKISDPSIIHIHFPGMDYVESFFQPINYFDKEEELPIQTDEHLDLLFLHSGLLEKSKLEANPNPGNPIVAENIETFYLSKNEILQKYADSAYPTQAIVNEVLEETFPEKYILDSDDIYEFITALQAKLKKENLTNTYMMQQFPGIHYNMVCRGVSETCETELQRSLSSQQEQRREQKNIEKILSQKIIVPKEFHTKRKKFQKRNQNKNKNKTQKKN